MNWNVFPKAVVLLAAIPVAFGRLYGGEPLGFAADTEVGAAIGRLDAPPPADAPYRNPALDVEARIDDLLPRLTDEEKMHLVHATSGMTMGHIPRIGLAVFRTPDAGGGPRAGGLRGQT